MCVMVSVSTEVAALALVMQSYPGKADPVAFPWKQSPCLALRILVLPSDPVRSPPSPPSTAPLSSSRSTACVHAFSDGSSPSAAICSNSLAACQVYVTSLEVTLTNLSCLRKCAGFNPPNPYIQLSKRRCPIETTRYNLFSF